MSGWLVEDGERECLGIDADPATGKLPGQRGRAIGEVERAAALFRGEVYRGYIPSKKCQYFDLKLHLLVTRQGEPVEFFLAPPVVDDTGLEVFDVDLPPGSEVYADHSYTHDEIEDLSREDADIYLLTMRKRNSRRPVPPRTIDVQRLYRNLGYVLQELRSAARPTKVRDP